MQEIPRWKINETQIQTLCTLRNSKIGNQLLGDWCSGGKLDKCKVAIIYRKYTWISNHINLLCTDLSLSWSWCGFLHGDYFSNGSWQKHSIMGDKVKQVALWTQAIKWKLVWYSKDWSIKYGSSSISRLTLCILQKRLSYLNLWWLLCNSLTQTIDNQFIDRITHKRPWKLCVESQRRYMKLYWIEHQETFRWEIWIIAITFGRENNQLFHTYIVHEPQIKIYTCWKPITA